MYSTNYFDTLIEVAEDCGAASGEVPPLREAEKSAAKLAYELLSEHPYEFTADDVLFAVFAMRKKFRRKSWRVNENSFSLRDNPVFARHR